MSSDDEDFNLDKLEAKDLKEEYDSDPSDTGNDSGLGDEEGWGSEEEAKNRVKAEMREQKAARKKISAPRKEKGEGKAKKKTKLRGQPKRSMSAFFMWLNSEGRDKIKEENPGFGVTELSNKTCKMWATQKNAWRRKPVPQRKSTRKSTRSGMRVGVKMP